MKKVRYGVIPKTILRKETEEFYNKRKEVSSFVIGELYWYLPPIGEDGWVHGRRLVATAKNVLTHPENSTIQYKNVKAVKAKK